jgi:hypothetical protein
MDEFKGQIISGKFGEILARQKYGKEFELGEILVAEDESTKQKFFLQVYDIQYGAQISQQNLELVSGMNLEEEAELQFMDKELRTYKIAFLKSLLTVKGKNTRNNTSNNNTDKDISNLTSASISKSLPEVFTKLRIIKNEDLSFITRPKSPLFFGNLRSGSQVLDVPLYLDGKAVLTHHILITGTTGKGKSVLMSNIIWDATSQDYCSLLVLDPHDEYYGRNNPKGILGLKDHPSGKVYYYTSKNPPKGALSLKINLTMLKPQHFGCLDFSDAQEQAMHAFYREHGTKWVEAIILDKTVKVNFIEATVSVLKRRLMQLLDLDFDGEQLFCNGIFDIKAGESTIPNIVKALEDKSTVIVDTSNFSGQVELLIGSMIATEIFRKYKNYKMSGNNDKPVVSIVLEEAPRVLGKEILERGSNIFSTIAREGRKFNVGLIAITQLPSLIPREILANINTKIILGTEMMNERQAIIDSASQDLSTDSRNIAALDKGECIISSNFAKFPIPVKIPFFQDYIKQGTIKKPEMDFGLE